MSHTQYELPYLLNFLYAIFEMKVFLIILLNNQFLPTPVRKMSQLSAAAGLETRGTHPVSYTTGTSTEQTASSQANTAMLSR